MKGIDLQFSSINTHKCYFEHATIYGDSYFKVSLREDADLTNFDLVCNDVLFDDNAEEGYPISCGLKKVLEVSERPDLSYLPPVLTDAWTIFSMDRRDKIFVVSKHNHKILIREQGQFPSLSHGVTEDDIKKASLKLYLFLKDDKISSLTFSLIFVRCNFSQELKLLTLVSHFDGQPKSEESVNAWNINMEVARPINFCIPKLTRTKLALAAAKSDTLKRLAFNGKSVISITDPWFCELTLRSHSLNKIENLIHLWITFKDRDFDKFAKVINAVETCSNLLTIQQAFRSIAFISSCIYKRLLYIEKDDERRLYLDSLPKYLRFMGWGILNKKSVSTVNLASLYHRIIKINNGEVKPAKKI